MYLILMVLYFTIQSHDCKIIREGDNFLAQFSLVELNSRITKNCVRNITRYTTPKECSGECAREKNCQSFNRHKLKGFCELLSISKFNQTGLLQRDLDWVHFETDDDEQNVGSLCTQLSPCKPYEICEETLRCNPAYKCRCRDGFEGDKCQLYKGPGYNKSSPAASCYLLMSKFKDLLDGNYWFRGGEKARKCERRVDGGYSPWSMFGQCTDVICGTRQRNRSCTNPTPKAGGRSCAELGPDTDVKPCPAQCAACSLKLFFDTPYTVKHRYPFLTFGSMLKEYKVQLDFMLDVSLMTEGYYYNIFHFTLDKTPQLNTQLGERVPAVFLYRPSNSQYINIQFHTGINKGEHHRKIGKSLTFFDHWIHIKIVQQEIAEKFVVESFLNGKLVWETENKQPQEFRDMKLYLSSGLRRETPGIIQVKNMDMQGYCDVFESTGYIEYLTEYF